jgi:hypothetical protein
MRGAVPTVVFDRECLIPLAQAAQHFRFGGDVDDLAFPLQAAMAGDHPRRFRYLPLTKSPACALV